MIYMYSVYECRGRTFDNNSVGIIKLSCVQQRNNMFIIKTNYYIMISSRNDLKNVKYFLNTVIPHLHHMCG